MLWWYDSSFGGARYLSAIVPLLLIFISALIYKLLQILPYLYSDPDFGALSIIKRTLFKPRFLIPIYIVLVCIIAPMNISSTLNYRRYNADMPEPVKIAQRLELRNAIVFVPNDIYKQLYLHENDPFLENDVIYPKASNEEKMKMLAVYLNREDNTYIYDQESNSIVRVKLAE